jgi:transposase InsO family protein
LDREKSQNEIFNEELAGIIKALYEDTDGILGYRQMTLKIRREHYKQVNYKRVYRLMQILGLKSVCRKKKYHYKISTPEVTAENILNRDFRTKHCNEKWLTDVTEFKFGANGEKAYLSAILDLGDRHIVSYVFGHRNNNQLVFDTFEQAVALNPDARPIFHSDRGFQYTSKIFKRKLDKAKMVQSMSRVGRCIDNGPMEGFWGILKSEMYYLHKFDDYRSLETAIKNYIDYYNNKRYQKRLLCMTPMEYRRYLQTA